jgi:hypothetical protein
MYVLYIVYFYVISFFIMYRFYLNPFYVVINFSKHHQYVTIYIFFYSIVKQALVSNFPSTCQSWSPRVLRFGNFVEVEILKIASDRKHNLSNLIPCPTVTQVCRTHPWYGQTDRGEKLSG